MDTVSEVQQQEENLLTTTLHPILPTQILLHTVFWGDIR